tara:strand:- start:81 stop:1211 length:1131 start_codon:yes stop_codon:yes gene_type:complete
MKKIKLNQKNLQTIVSRVIKESQLLLEKLTLCQKCRAYVHGNPGADPNNAPEDACNRCRLQTNNPGKVVDGPGMDVDGGLMMTGDKMMKENRYYLTEEPCAGGCGTSCQMDGNTLMDHCLYVAKCYCDEQDRRCCKPGNTCCEGKTTGDGGHFGGVDVEVDAALTPADDSLGTGGIDPRGTMGKETMKVSESELINSIERIVKEQTAVLGFGNFGNLGIGPIGTPTSKYQELGEDDETYNVNVSNKGDDPDYTDDGFGMFEDDDLEDIEENVKYLVRKKLEEAQAKEAGRWIQNAVKRPGALRKKLGTKKGEKISLEKINQEMRKLKAKDTNKKKAGVQGLTKADLKTYKQLNLAKTLRGLAKKKQAKESTKWVRK